jgi:hypothetical protein
MPDVSLKLYSGTTEFGTLANPISFGSPKAGAITYCTHNPLYLWNDKGGIIGSNPAKNIWIEMLEMWIEEENMGVSDGSADQTFTTVFTPVLDNNDPDELIVMVGSTVWTRTDNLSGAVGTAEVYFFDATTGTVTFGDSVHGAIPGNGETIYITYMPDLLLYGKEIYDQVWLEVKSSGVTSYTVTVMDEAQESDDTTHVTVTNTKVLSVSGVWLSTDLGHIGTNYYTGGSFDADTGILILGSALPGATTNVLINYTYTIIDDAESEYTSLGYSGYSGYSGVSGLGVHTFANPIPQNNAKLLYFRLNVPDEATTTAGSQVNFRVRINYEE